MTVLLAGVVAHMGMLGLTTVMVTAWVGGVAGDVLWYAVGRSGAAAMQKRAIYTRVGPTIERMAGRIGAWEVAAARFLYGAHTASMLFWGVHRLPLTRFLALSIFGCGLWASAFVGLGYVLSNSATLVLGDVKRAERWLFGALVVVGAGAFALQAFTRRRLRGSGAVSQRPTPPGPDGRS